MNELFEEVANYVDITWDMTDAEEKKLQSMIDRAKAALSGKIGPCDFDSETPEKTLLLNHVMYERSGALADFWVNYAGEITSLRLNRKAKKYAEKEAVYNL